MRVSSLITLAACLILSISIQGQNTKRYDRMIKNGDRFFSSFAYTKAIEKYTKAFEENPGAFYPKLRLADSYRLMNVPETSEQWYEQIANDDDFTDQSRLDYSQVLMKNGKYRLAQDIVQAIQDPMAANSDLAKKVKALKDEGI